MIFWSLVGAAWSLAAFIRTTSAERTADVLEVSDSSLPKWVDLGELVADGKSLQVYRAKVSDPDQDVIVKLPKSSDHFATMADLVNMSNMPDMMQSELSSMARECNILNLLGSNRYTMGCLHHNIPSSYFEGFIKQAHPNGLDKKVSSQPSNEDKGYIFSILKDCGRSLLDSREDMMENKTGDDKAKLVLTIYIKLLLALKFLFGKVVHMDIKPENIAISARESGGPPVYDIRFIDFGGSFMAGLKANEFSYTRGYAPAERWGVEPKWSSSWDSFSLTSVLIFLLTGKDPLNAVPKDWVGKDTKGKENFDFARLNKYVKNVASNKPAFPFSSSFSRCKGRCTSDDTADLRGVWRGLYNKIFKLALQGWLSKAESRPTPGGILKLIEAEEPVIYKEATEQFEPH